MTFLVDGLYGYHCWEVQNVSVVYRTYWLTIWIWSNVILLVVPWMRILNEVVFFNMVKRIQWELLWWLESMLLKCLLYSRYRKCTCNFEIHYHKWSSWISNEASSGLPREPADTTSNTKFKWCRNHTSQHLVAERNNTEEMSSVKL